MLRQYELDRSLAIIETLALPNVGRTQAAWKRFRRLLRMKAQRDAQRNLMAKWKGMMQLVSNVLLLLRRRPQQQLLVPNGTRDLNTH